MLGLTSIGTNSSGKGKGLRKSIIWLNGKISANLRVKVAWVLLIQKR
jgi:hypothetical protein